MIAFVKDFNNAQYPSLYSIVKVRIPKLRFQKPNVFRAFVKWSKMSEEAAWAAMFFAKHWLGFNRGPEIRLTDNMRGYGHYPGGGNVILIRKLFADQFESLMSRDPLGRDPGGHHVEEQLGISLSEAQRRAGLLMESKILHEMVHWGWKQVLPADPEPSEIGWHFEVEAYGRELTATALSIRRKGYIILPHNS